MPKEHGPHGRGAQRRKTQQATFSRRGFLEADSRPWDLQSSANAR